MHNSANDTVRWGLVADHNVIPGYQIGDALPNKNKKNINGKTFLKNRCMILGIGTRIIYDFFVIIQGSYMISLVSYKDRTKKSSMDSMRSYMILVWYQRNFSPGKFWLGLGATRNNCSRRNCSKILLSVAVHLARYFVKKLAGRHGGIKDTCPLSLGGETK